MEIATVILFKRKFCQVEPAVSNACRPTGSLTQQSDGVNFLHHHDGVTGRKSIPLAQHKIFDTNASKNLQKTTLT